MTLRRLGLFALVLACALASACSPGRSTARIATLERTVTSGDDTSTSEWSFSYNDQGELEEIEIDGASSTTTYEMEYDEGRIVEIRQLASGDDPDFIMEIEWDEGRIVAREDRQGDGFDRSVDFEYDDAGRLDRVESLTSSGLVTADLDVEIAYNDDGTIDDWEESLRESAGPFEVTIETRHSLRYDDEGRLEKVRNYLDGGDNGDIEYEYDDQGRLAELDNNGKEIEVAYDDAGRIEEVEIGGGDDVWQVTYEDGAISGLFHTPPGIPYPSLFDLGGRPVPDGELLTFERLTTW